MSDDAHHPWIRRARAGGIAAYAIAVLPTLWVLLVFDPTRTDGEDPFALFVMGIGAFALGAGHLLFMGLAPALAARTADAATFGGAFARALPWKHVAVGALFALGGLVFLIASIAATLGVI